MSYRTIRLNYPIEPASKKIIDAGLPDIYAYRLFDGV